LSSIAIKYTLSDTVVFDCIPFPILRIEQRRGFGWINKICGISMAVKKSVVTKYTKFSEHKVLSLMDSYFIM